MIKDKMIIDSVPVNHVLACFFCYFLNDNVFLFPGQFGDRRTMLGELNWIFTAITDTIAWNTLPRDLFQKLFRQDLLVASLFRNFLLAERIMRSYDCTPISQPALPPTHQHSMWKAWDLAVDMCLAQLANIVEKGVPYQSSSFFEEQLTAFEVRFIATLIHRKIAFNYFFLHGLVLPVKDCLLLQ